MALLGLFLRLWKLGEPKAFSFDETYYAKDAWSLLHFGYARDYIGDADKAILGGQTTDLWKDTPSLIVHPDVGKWLIALGEKAFGMDPFGWRISAAVVGALMILVMCRFVRRLTGSTLLGCVGGLLLCFDGLHLVLSRLALLDIFLAFFLLCAVHCLVADRDWFRRRMAARAVLDPGGRVAETAALGPVRGLLLRPWLLAGGRLLRPGRRHQVDRALPPGGVRRPGLGLERRGAPLLRGPDGVARGPRWSTACRRSSPSSASGSSCTSRPGPAGWCTPTSTRTPASRTRSTPSTTAAPSGRPRPSRTPRASARWSSRCARWAHYQHDVYVFHTKFLNDSTHPYSSKPAGWLLLNRPVGVDAQNDIKPGVQGCAAPADSTCQRQVLLLGNPVIWWGGCLALLWGLLQWVGARDWRYGVAAGRGRAPPGCPGCGTTTGRSSCSTRWPRCRSWCSP